QQFYLEKIGTRFVFLADEFYLQTGKEIPAEEDYEGFPQLENGVGIVRLFIDDFAEALKNLPKPIPVREQYLVATGYAAAPVLTKAIEQLNRWIEGPPINLVQIENNFLGPSVTVAGL